MYLSTMAFHSALRCSQILRLWFLP
jgi:hypothetical protein